MPYRFLTEVEGPDVIPTLPLVLANKRYVDAQISAGGVPGTRAINTTAPLSGGGTLATDLTLDVAVFTATVNGVVPAPTGTPTGLNVLKDDGTWGPGSDFTEADADLLYVKLAGDAMTGALDMGTNAITGLALVPTAPADATSKSYVDALVSGLSWKESARAASDGDLTLSGTQTVDGVALAAGDRVLVKDQATATDNGVYEVAAAAWTRTADAADEEGLVGAAVYVGEGGQGNTTWFQATPAPITVGTSPITWTQVNSGAGITVGAGLVMTANTVDVVAANGSIVVGADAIEVGFDANGTAVTASRSDHIHTTYVDVAGDTMTGPLALPAAAPTLPEQAANKAYVDSLLTGLTRKFTADVGDGTATAVTLAHGLASRDVTVEVYATATPWDTIGCVVTRPDADTVTLTFDVAPAAGAYRAVIVG